MLAETVAARFHISLERFQIVGPCVRGDHGVHQIVHNGRRIYGVSVVDILLSRRLGSHKGGHHLGHVHRLRFDGYGIARERILLDLVYEVLDPVRERHYQRYAYNAYASGKGCEQGPRFFGQQVVPGKGQGGPEGHGGLALFAFCLFIGRGFRIRVAVRGNKTVLQPDYSCSISLCKLRVVRDHYYELRIGDLLQNIHYLNGSIAVQGSGRLVGKKDIRIVDQSSRYGDSLHLPAGHLVGLLVELVAQSDFFKSLFRPLPALPLVHSGKREGKLYVRKNALVGYQVI